jgi:hypothetical protein
MRNIHILPTDKPSRLVYFNNKLLFAPNDGFIIADGKQHIYITSDEEIERDDYYVDLKNNQIYRADSEDVMSKYMKFCKKIILTTDQDLIADGVQEIDDEFLEWFVKNLNCERVEIEKEECNYEEYRCYYDYKIIVPKEEPKQRLEKYSERFDNKENEIVQGVFNPENWGRRLVEDKQETLEDKLKSLVKEWQERQWKYQDIAQNAMNEQTDRKFTYKAMATRDCWKELLKIIEYGK